MVRNVWEALGLSGKRVLLLHHDDLGLTHAQTEAYRALGFPTGSVMVPGGWGVGLRGADLGVHLTLTSELPAPRLRPLTPGKSLRDPTGHFWPTLEAAWTHLDPGEVEEELEAQVRLARAWGLDPTHLDAHMGAVLRPDLAEVYLRLAERHGLPPLLPENLEELGPPPLFLPELKRLLERAPFPKVWVLDGYGVPPAERKAWLVERLAALGPGVYQLIHHAALPTPENAALPDGEGRSADLALLRDPEVKRVLEEFVPLTWRTVGEAWRRGR
ncbi:carbohydrate deacetylase [Thermus oshimai]|jgi:hypothetical protein|uniref:carbohydrate deacetylase n=1 Tax=Thermus TaxID=270 RepID=UPI0030B63A40